MFLPLLIFPCTIKSRSSFLAPAHPGGPGKRAVKWLCVSVCIFLCLVSVVWYISAGDVPADDADYTFSSSFDLVKFSFLGHSANSSVSINYSSLLNIQRWVSRLHFWATVCKTVRPMLSVRCLSCPVCNVRALWPNGWMDQDEAWHAGRPQPWPHCVRWGPSSPSPKGAQLPNFWPISVVAKWLHGSRCHLVWR